MWRVRASFIFIELYHNPFIRFSPFYNTVGVANDRIIE